MIQPHGTDEILSNLEHAISEEPQNQHELLPDDKWLITSSLQKAIRRGETARALQATASLWHADKKKLWMRLNIITLEDISIGSVDVVVQALTATASSAWRRKVGDLRVALHITRLLSESVKNRLADSIFIQAERALQYGELREGFARATDQTLADYVTDEGKPLVERAIAIWLLAGTKKYPSDFMPPRAGSLDTAISALRALTAPKALTEACIGATKLTPWPLALFITLIWQEAKKHQRHIQQHVIPAMPTVESLPLYAADCFTRIGKASYRQLQRDVPELKAYNTQQIGLGMFYLEGGMVDKELTSPSLAAIQRASEITDVGLPVPEYERLRDCLTHNMEALTAIRRERLQQHFADLRKSSVGA